MVCHLDGLVDAGFRGGPRTNGKPMAYLDTSGGIEDCKNMDIRARQRKLDGTGGHRRDRDSGTVAGHP